MLDITASNSIVAVRLKNVISEKGLKQASVASKAGFTSQELNDMLNGRKIWENDIIKYRYGDYYAPVKFGEYQSCFDSTTTCHVGFYVDWDEKRDFRKDLGYWVKMVDAEVVGNIHDKPEQQKDQRSTIIYKDFMKKGRE